MPELLYDKEKSEMFDGGQLVIQLNKIWNEFYNYTYNCHHRNRRPASFHFAFVKDDLEGTGENSEIKYKSNCRKIITFIGK